MLASTFEAKFKYVGKLWEKGFKKIKLDFIGQIVPKKDLHM